MRILGIHDAIDSGAALLEDGKLTAAVAEERLIRAKLAYGFPRQSIFAVLQIADLQPSDIDRVAIATRNNYFVDPIVPFKGWYETRGPFYRHLFLSVASRISPLAVRMAFLESLYYSLRFPIFRKRRESIKRLLREDYRLTCPVEFIDHHLAHASSAYYSSGFRDATVVSLDGGGDGSSSSIYAVRNGEFTKLHEGSSLNSIGNFYSYVTHICGFVTHKHEGKITGLAAFGEPRHLDMLRGMVGIREGRIINKLKLFGRNAIEHLERTLPPDFSHADLAASIQQLCEEITTEYVAYWLKRTGLPDVALAGGLFANVKINQRVSELEGVERVFVNPAMGDDGIAAGAALIVHQRLAGGDSRKAVQRCLEHVLLGPEYSEEDIRRQLDESRLPYVRSECIEDEIGQLLAEGYVVARFNGRMEYGPRALGNRSILYQPSDPSVNDWLNKDLKRTEFMPFAPATLVEYADQSYVGINGASDTARFMTITFGTTEWMRKHCAGAVHIDNTCRPQLVRRIDNPSFYKIIDAYRERTGIPTVINTSFNIHEEPIVCTPADAVRAFKIGHLDYLAMGSFLVKNPRPLQRTLKPSLKASEFCQSR